VIAVVALMLTFVVSVLAVVALMLTFIVSLLYFVVLVLTFVVIAPSHLGAAGYFLLDKGQQNT
jgi:hypothetical protein